MAINLVRIDDRLIHGQVVEGWLRVIKANKIVVISDDLAQKENEKILFSMAVPSDVQVSFLTIEDAVSYFEKESRKDEHILVLVESPKTILELLEIGIKFESVNVGGLHFAPGKVAVSDNLYLSREDCRILEKIAEYKVIIEGRALPNDRRLNVLEEIKKIRVFQEKTEE